MSSKGYNSDLQSQVVEGDKLLLLYSTHSSNSEKLRGEVVATKQHGIVLEVNNEPSLDRVSVGSFDCWDEPLTLCREDSRRLGRCTLCVKSESAMMTIAQINR